MEFNQHSKNSPSDVFQGKSAENDATWFQKAFFFWTTPLIDASHKKMLVAEQLGKPNPLENIDICLDKLELEFKNKNGNDNGLAKILLKHFAYDCLF